MRLFFLLTLAVALATSARAASVNLVRVWPSYYPADAFDRISEYFTGEEKTDNRTVLRSQPSERAGHYWLVRTRCDAALPGATLELQVISPASPEPKTYTFAINLPAGSHATLAGLTGQDWPGARAKPVAWHLRILAPDGTVLAQTQSFLWSKSAGAHAAN